MILDEKQFKNELYKMIDNELTSVIHIYITEYYGPYELCDSLIAKLTAERQFRLYVDDYFHDFLSQAMIDCVTDESTKNFIKDVLFEYQLNPFYLEQILENMKTRN